MPPPIRTVREHIAWSYANLGRAHAAVQHQCEAYGAIHHIIRSKLYGGLTTGKITMRSLYDDERVKMTAPRVCCYCGEASDHLAIDHLIPKIKGGEDEAGNLVLACRTCNGSKQGRDLLEWMTSKQRFPPLLVLRRYIKIVAGYCESHDLMERELADVAKLDLPFDLALLPYQFPPLSELRL